MTVFDPYYRWLAIPPAEQPPTLYRLLGLTPFESDPSVIEEAADRQMAHVKTHHGGQFSAESQRLLNELAQAKLVLLDPARRAKYDALLAQSPHAAAATPPPLPIPPVAPMPPAVRPPLVVVREIHIAPAAPPVAAPAPTRRNSVVAERWLAQERTKAAFLKLLSKSLLLIAVAAPPCVVAYFVAQRALQPAQPAAQAIVAPADKPALGQTAPASAIAPQVAQAAEAPAIPREPAQRPAPLAGPLAVRAPMPALPPAELYPLRKVWFLDWIGDTWENDVSADFNATRSDRFYLIKCDFADGNDYKLIVFGEEDATASKLSIRFQLEDGSLFFDIRPKDLSYRGKRGNAAFPFGKETTVELWIQDGRPWQTVDGVPAPMDPETVPHGYFAIGVSRRCELRIFDLRIRPQQ